MGQVLRIYMHAVRAESKRSVDEDFEAAFSDEAAIVAADETALFNDIGLSSARGALICAYIKEAEMYFHPMAREAASRHYVGDAPQEPAGYLSGNAVGGSEMQMREIRQLCIMVSLKVELTP